MSIEKGVTRDQVEALMDVWRRLDLNKPVILVGSLIEGGDIIRSTGDIKPIMSQARRSRGSSR